ncbi:MAG: hypothetical protein KatS3mg109_1015 [Pirellulaceae bacterium]|nr:MAG: hypothetical protein KatS3mg109_1015 [Pirellulaceae bacterium]GIW95058.1 MAG: hypothetical protein KatS3mg110_3099 [Pirellulaceae bacterium]
MKGRPTFGWFPILGMLIAMAIAARLPAVTVLVRGESEPIYGYLVRQDDQQIVVRIAQPDGSWAERVLARDQIEFFYQPIDEARLEALDPKRPEEYREYAEVLAEKKKDPEARELSLRLYWLAAVLAPKELGKSCLLGMTQLAESEAEARRYRAAAYLLDPSRDRSLLEWGSTVKEDVSLRGLTDAERAAFRALEAYRRGDYSRALQYAQREGVKEVFQRLGGPIGYEELCEACRKGAADRPRPDAGVAVQILLMEKRLWDTSSGADSSGELRAWYLMPRDSWNYVAKPLSLNELLPFDARAVVFRNGKWMRPEELARVDAASR